MKSNEDYLDELLNSMSQDPTEESPLARFGLQNSEGEEVVAPVTDMGMGKMDQSMIDALLAGAAGEPVAVEEETVSEPEQVSAPVTDMGMGKMDQSMIDALLAGAAGETEDIEEEPMPENMESFLEEQLTSDVDFSEEDGLDSNSSMLEKLMEDMKEDTAEDGSEDMMEEDFMTEESIEVLLNAAKEGSDSMYDESSDSFDISDDSSMAELDALLGMSEAEGEEDDDENSALLRMLQEAEAATPDFMKSDDDIVEVDEAELEAILSQGGLSETSESTQDNEQPEKEKKEKKSSGLKGFFEKVFSALMEEVEDEEIPEKERINLSEENKSILEDLDSEEDKKIKVKDKKKGKKDKKEKVKKEKPKKEKPKKEKPKKEKKQKVPKVAQDSGPERKIPRKKIIVTFIFGFSLLALILLVEMLVPSILTQSRARSAYDKGDYYEAYKEYYGMKLSEEDEIRFQGATTILRMQSNLDGYNNYLKLNKEVHAVHSLLEAVKVKFDVFLKAEEFNVLPQVNAVYEQILEILYNKYHLSEETALELTQEKSDAVYTRKLQALVEGKSYIDSSSGQMNQNDMLPEEEIIFNH